MVEAALHAAVLVTVIGLHWRQESRGPEEPHPTTAVANGDVLRAADVPVEQPPAPPAGDRCWDQGWLQAGTTHRIRTKGGFSASVDDDDDEDLGDDRPEAQQGQAQRVVYAFDAVVRRTIESNDGHRIVEVREFESIRKVILIARAEMDLDIGPPGEPLLDRFAWIDSDPGSVTLAPVQVAESLLHSGARAVREDVEAAAAGIADSLAGKRVRMTHLAGTGVESLVPLGCELTTEDVTYLLATPLWGDLLPPPPAAGAAKGAGVWPWRPASLAAVLGPALRHQPVSEVWLRRLSGDLGGAVFAVAAAEAGQEAAGARPEGELRVRDGRIVAAQLLWSIDGVASFLLSSLLSGLPMHELTGFDFSYSHSSDPATEQPALTQLAPYRDLAAGLALIAGMSICLAAVGFRLARVRSRQTSNVLATFAVAFMLAFGLWMHRAAWLAQLLPVSNVIILGNWLPLASAFFAGIIFGQRGVPATRRVAAGLLIAILGGYATASDMMLHTVPTTRSWSREGVCLQTLPETCSPSSAVTLLKRYGIHSTEGEMSQLCLTRRRGTTVLGLYRGLKLKTRQTPWDVEVVRGGIEQLRRYPDDPVLLRVQPEASQATWWPGTGAEHSVVLLGFTSDGGVEIGDPANAARPRLKWTIEDLEERWKGEGFRIVRRDRVF